MRSEEIVKALRCCADHSCSAKCPAYQAGLDCREEMHKAVLNLVENLTTENADMRKEVAELREKVPQWISVEDASIKLAAQALETTPERLRELAAADKEGRVVILPCKRGSKIYAPRKRGIDTYEVIAIAEDEKGVQLLGKCKCSEESWVTDVFNACDFGKNVFLTREEAEQAMEGQKHD